jgi:putative endonuclease
MDEAARDRGLAAERLAARFLRTLGFEILACNLRTASGEIDVAAREGGAFVLVEVRYRAPHVVLAWRSLSREKRDHLLRAGHEARRLLRIPAGTPLRFDVVLLASGGRMTHIRGALPPSRPYRP